MPSSLETLIKILRLEQDTGYKNTAVIGGLEAFIPNWTREAHTQAKTDQQHDLVDELGRVMIHYNQESNRVSRQKAIKYMLGRITGRVDHNPDFLVDASEYTEIVEQAPIPKPKPEPKPKSDDGFYMDSDADYEAPLTTEAETNRRKDEQAIATKPRRVTRPPLNIEESFELLRHLEQPVSELRGVGEKRAEQLAKLGIQTINDLLFHFPRRYDDYTDLAPLHRLEIGKQIAAIGTVQKVIELMSRQKKPYLQVVLDDGSGQLNVTFFNQAFLKRLLKPGTQIVVYGKTDLYRGKPTMTNPEWEPVDQRSLKRGNIVPVYPLTQGISSKVMRKLILQALEEWANKIPDYVPESVLDRTEMVDLNWALQQVHFPKKPEYVGYARERLAFDELILLQLGVLVKRFEWQHVPGIPLPVNDGWLEDFRSVLPYQLTNAQQRAIEAISEDVQRDIPMNRLLQGDVGSGKTVVAACTLAMAVANGKQAALMAPTSILAEQHFQSLSGLLSNLPNGADINIRLLTGGTSDSERNEIYDGLSDGSIHLIIGTHALIQSRVEFAELAVAIIDEQHRFGVEERGALRGKGTNPHVLVMTATPIPRTLALTMYADLDLTILDEMPPGRTPIDTRFVYENERQRAYGFIRNQLIEGRQAFIIYPLVEDSESIDAKSAVASYEDLKETVFSDCRVGLLHGRMSPTEKDDIMAAVASGEIQLLVSTSVIEVGIDVPNATVIMIEDANRFGLAQLHQFRGRVGRGQYESYCLLLSDSDKEDSLARLKALETTTDGFQLAELDWQLRGPGDLLGTRQAGMGQVQMDSVMDIRLVELAQQESRALFAEDPELNLPEHTLMSQRIRAIRSRQTDFS